MYWIEWRESAVILRALMDGRNMTVIIQNHTVVMRPRALVIDYLENMIYWTDERHGSIYRARSDGTGLESVVLQHLPHPYCVTQYKDFIFWGDHDDNTISRANKLNGGNRTMIEANIGYIMDVKVFHGTRQVGWNDCGIGNGGCSHLCIPLPGKKHTCACPNHFSIDEEKNTTCIGK